MLAVGLGNSVYMWNAATSQVSKLCDMTNDTVTSVNWIERVCIQLQSETTIFLFDQQGTHLAVGSNNGTVQIWDVSRKKQIREMGGHRSRVGSLAWNSALLSSGSRDKVLPSKLKAVSVTNSMPVGDIPP